MQFYELMALGKGWVLIFSLFSFLVMTPPPPHPPQPQNGCWQPPTPVAGGWRLSGWECLPGSNSGPQEVPKETAALRLFIWWEDSGEKRQNFLVRFGRNAARRDGLGWILTKVESTHSQLQGWGWAGPGAPKPCGPSRLCGLAIWAVAQGPTLRRAAPLV